MEISSTMSEWCVWISGVYIYALYMYMYVCMYIVEIFRF